MGVRLVIFTVGLFVLSSCSNESSDREAARERATALAQSTNATQNRNQQLAQVTQGAVTLIMGKKKGKPGETACLPVTVSGFTKLLSTQYSIKWDPSILTFESVQSFKLPFFGPANFGQPNPDGGVLTCVWIDNNLSGITLSDGAPIYEVCFNISASAKSGAAAVEITNQPTPFESVNYDEQILTINPIAGGVEIQ